MTADELRAALEAELKWRQEELAFFKNQLNEIVEENKNKYRKSLVLQVCIKNFLIGKLKFLIFCQK